MVIGSQELIHDINSRLVLTHIINHGPLSRATLSKQLGLTKATISAIVQELIDKYLIIELGSDNTPRGRKPILLTFNPCCGYVIAIDLDKEDLTFMTCNLKGEDYKIKHYPNDQSESQITSYLTRLIQEQIDTLPSTPYGVVGICLGVHGVVDDNKITFMPYSPYCSIDFANVLGEHFSIPVYLENEANLSIIGEKTFCYNYPNMVGISIHSGIGLGLILNHELFSGYNGYAGEFGHTIVEFNGKPCPCGNLGCFEQYTSTRALLLDFAERKGISNATLQMLVEAYQNGDGDALHVVGQFVQYMAIGINNILNMFNPNVIVINSGLVSALPELTDEMTALLKNRMREFCHLLPSGLSDTSIVLGGICICIQRFLGVSNLDFKMEDFVHFNTLGTSKLGESPTELEGPHKSVGFHE